MATHQKEQVFIVRDKHGTMKAQLPRSIAVKVVAVDHGQWEDANGAACRRIRVTTPSVIPIPLSADGPEIRLYLWEGDTLSPEQ